MIAVYRSCFHPYTKCPGPLLARINWTYNSYYRSLKEAPLVTQPYLLERYGPVIRITPDTLLFYAVEAFKAIYGPGKNFRKRHAYRPMKHDPSVEILEFFDRKKAPDLDACSPLASRAMRQSSSSIT